MITVVYSGDRLWLQQWTAVIGDDYRGGRWWSARTEVEVGVDEGCESILVIQIRIEIITEAEMFFCVCFQRDNNF